MAELDYTGYREDVPLAAAYIPRSRILRFVVDFTKAGNQVATATDSINLGELPKGTIVRAGGLEQIVAGSAGNTVAARVGTVSLSATLASDATAGTVVAATADATDLRPIQLTADTDFNLISASGIRATGKIRAWVMIMESGTPFAVPALAPRDTSTGLA
jgi:hypothetical protein